MQVVSILALQKTSGIGAETIKKILSLPNCLEPDTPFDLLEILNEAKAKFGRISVPDIQAAEIGWNAAHEILDISQQHDIRIISKDSSDYPKPLLKIQDPPALLHVKGNIGALNKDCIAIVGTRNPTSFGTSQAKKCGKSFAKGGYVIVSGLAKGVDSAAHKGALESNGLTVAVLAHGLDTIYPSVNKQLADNILENNGALISEYPWGTNSNRSFFVSRNRIQSGLSLGTLVVETKTNGGTMHTVRFCEKQDRALIVIKPPENLIENENTRGNTQLITEKRANVVLENDNDIDMVKTKMENIKYALLNPEVSGQQSSFALDRYAIGQKNVDVNADYMNSKSSFQTNDDSIKVKDKTEKYVTKSLFDF
ncbi:MAG TPA: DNA-protecting protein DprA [Methanosarcinaceae archaeon]|nr:DNA-protecting protein DprA [Methanosarcinaceae archaeon]